MPLAISDHNGVGDYIGNARIEKPSRSRPTIQNAILGNKGVAGVWLR